MQGGCDYTTSLDIEGLIDRMFVYYRSCSSFPPLVSVCVCVYYYSTYYKSVRGGEGGWRVEDMCYERLRAEVSVN